MGNGRNIDVCLFVFYPKLAVSAFYPDLAVSFVGVVVDLAAIQAEFL